MAMFLFCSTSSEFPIYFALADIVQVECLERGHARDGQWLRRMLRLLIFAASYRARQCNERGRAGISIEWA